MRVITYNPANDIENSCATLDSVKRDMVVMLVAAQEIAIYYVDAQGHYSSELFLIRPAQAEFSDAERTQARIAFMTAKALAKALYKPK